MEISGPIIRLCRCCVRASARGATCSPKLRHQPPLTPGARPFCSVHWSLPANLRHCSFFGQHDRHTSTLVAAPSQPCPRQTESLPAVYSKPETQFFPGHWIIVFAPAGRCASSRRRCARRRASHSRSQRRCPHPRRPLRSPRWASHKGSESDVWPTVTLAPGCA